MLLAHSDVSPSILRTQKVAQPGRSRTSSLGRSRAPSHPAAHEAIFDNECLDIGDINIVNDALICYPGVINR